MRRIQSPFLAMSILYHRAEYYLNAPNLQTTPDDIEYEVAFAGRSNAGKSSAINTITNQKSLARTSKTPGRTQQLVYFKLDDSRCLVDLPGYGYAKVPPKVQIKWQQELERYLEKRKALNGLVLLVDIRRSLGEYDLQMIEYANHINLDIFIALTKSDKLNRNNAKKTLFAAQKLLADSSNTVQIELFSSLKKEGVKPLHQWLNSHLNVGA